MVLEIEKITKNRDLFLEENPKYGDLALKETRKVKDYHELSKLLKCNKCMASTLINELLDYGLYIKDKDGKLKKSKELIRIGLKPKNIENQITEKFVRVKNIKKINFKILKKEIESYIQDNFTKIKNPFNKEKFEVLSEVKLKRASDILIQVLDEELDFDDTEGLAARFYESFVNYFSNSRNKKSEVILAFSSLIKNFEPYLKKLVYKKTKDKNKARLSLGKELLQSLINFNSDLKKTDESYWKDKEICEACIRYVYPFRHMEAHEARNWDIFEMEKVVFYMFASIILINLKQSFTKNI